MCTLLHNSILQLIFIALGFLFATFVVIRSSNDWEQTPVITTLDSIAAPIDLIQFPTITVCRNEYKPPDNWALLEIILNNVAFQCFPDGTWIDPEGGDYFSPPCNETVNIRQDFKDLINPVTNIFKKWIYNPKYANIPLLRHVDLNEQDPLMYNQLETEVTNQVINKTLSIKFLQALSYNCIACRAMIVDILSIYTDLPELGIFSYNEFLCEKRCHSLKANRIKKVLQLLGNMINNHYTNQPFGSFMATFAHLDKFQSQTFDSKEIPAFTQDLCELLKPKDKLLHDYFKQLSRSVGLDEGELVSLYDLPSIVATIRFKDIESPKFFQSYLYSRCNMKPNYTQDAEENCQTFWCQIKGKLKWDDINKCQEYWTEFINNPKTG